MKQNSHCILYKQFLHVLNCRLKVIGPYNHGSRKVGKQIKAVSDIIVKHLWDKGQMWPLFATTAAYAMNTFASEALNGFSPFQMMAKAIMPVLDVLKDRIADTNQRLTSQYRMIQMAHHRYNLLFRQTHDLLTIHHFALILFKNYLTIQVGMLQRIHHQYNRYESSLDDTLIGIESLSSGYLTHHIMDPKVLARYFEAIADDM